MENQLVLAMIELKNSLSYSPGNSSFDFCPGLIYIETPGISFKIAKIIN
jgi:hypothetical protein